MTVRHQHPWEYPNCPSCGSDVLVEGIPDNEASGYKCHACDVRFNRDYTDNGDLPENKAQEIIEKRRKRGENTMRGKRGNYNYTFDLEYAKLLEFLQGYDRKYIKANHLEHDYDIGRMQAGRMFTGLHERGLIEKWTDGDESPWILTDKGKNIDPMELVE